MYGLEWSAFIAPARQNSALWRTCLGAVLIVVIYAAPFAAFMWWLALDEGPAWALGLVWELTALDTPRAVLLLLATFLPLAVAVPLVAWVLHRRGLSSLLGRGVLVLRGFVGAALVTGVIYVAGLAIWGMVFDPLPGVPLDLWLRLLPLTLLGIAIQTGAEELVFRGYLMQQLAARFRSSIIWMLLPSLLFGAIHYQPGMTPANAAFVVGGAALFGLLAADLTAVSGGLGAAWGFHFANNFFALALIATQGTITGLGLFLTPYSADAGAPDIWVVAGDLAMLIVSWAICRAVVRR